MMNYNIFQRYIKRSINSTDDLVSFVKLFSINEHLKLLDEVIKNGSLNDEIIKREIVDFIGTKINSFSVRVFPEGSNDDQKKYEDGGLTFSHAQQDYGSCDCAYVKRDGNKEIPIIAIEGTDCLSRGQMEMLNIKDFIMYLVL